MCKNENDYINNNCILSWKVCLYLELNPLEIYMKNDVTSFTYLLREFVNKDFINANFSNV